MQNYKKMCNIKTISTDIYWISGKFVGINYALLPNREWNQKQKHKKQPWSNVECFAFGGGIVRLCGIGNEFPCRQPHNPSATLSRGLTTLPQG